MNENEEYRRRVVEEEYEPLPKVTEERNIIELDKFQVLDRVAINRFGRNDAIYSYYFMYPLDDKEAAYLDKIRDQLVKDPTLGVRLELKDGTPISFSNILIYGNFDFKDKEHVEIIKNYLAKDMYDCHRIPREYNYENNTSVSKGKFLQWTESTDYLKAFKYYHARIGKPEKYIIVKLTANEAKQRR